MFMINGNCFFFALQLLTTEQTYISFRFVIKAGKDDKRYARDNCCLA